MSATKKTVLAIGVTIIALGAIVGLPELSYVLYWGPMPDSSDPLLFPYYSFWGGLAFHYRCSCNACRRIWRERMTTRAGKLNNCFGLAAG